MKTKIAPNSTPSPQEGSRSMREGSYTAWSTERSSAPNPQQTETDTDIDAAYALPKASPKASPNDEPMYEEIDTYDHLNSPHCLPGSFAQTENSRNPDQFSAESNGYAHLKLPQASNQFRPIENNTTYQEVTFLNMDNSSNFDLQTIQPLHRLQRIKNFFFGNRTRALVTGVATLGVLGLMGYGLSRLKSGAPSGNQPSVEPFENSTTLRPTAITPGTSTTTSPKGYSTTTPPATSIMTTTGYFKSSTTLAPTTGIMSTPANSTTSFQTTSSQTSSSTLSTTSTTTGQASTTTITAAYTTETTPISSTITSSASSTTTIETTSPSSTTITNTATTPLTVTITSTSGTPETTTLLPGTSTTTTNTATVTTVPSSTSESSSVIITTTTLQPSETIITTETTTISTISTTTVGPTLTEVTTTKGTATTTSTATTTVPTTTTSTATTTRTTTRRGTITTKPTIAPGRRRNLSTFQVDPETYGWADSVYNMLGVAPNVKDLHHRFTQGLQSLQATGKSSKQIMELLKSVADFGQASAQFKVAPKEWQAIAGYKVIDSSHGRIPFMKLMLDMYCA